MKYVKFHGETGYCGCDFDEYEKYDDNVTEEFLNEVLDDMVHENGESFEYCATGWGNSWESEEEEDEYYENCSGSWEFITKEEYEEMGGV